MSITVNLYYTGENGNAHEWLESVEDEAYNKL